MSLNWKEIEAVLDELALPGSRIQRIRQPNYHDLVLEVYSPGERRTVLVCLKPGETRIHAVVREPKSEVGLQRFAQLLRSRTIGGIITRASQIGRERIVHLSIERSGETTELYCRLWSGAANIVATDSEGTILDAFYRRPKRGEISGASYDPLAAVRRAGGKKRRDFELRPFLLHTDSGEPQRSLSERIDAYYGDVARREKERKLRERLLADNSRETARVESAVRDIAARLDEAERFEEIKSYADLLATNIPLVARGASSVTVPDYGDPGRRVVIELDPKLKPGENVDRYYRRYKSVKARFETLSQERAALERRLAELARSREAIGAAKGFEALKRSESGGGDTASRAPRRSTPGVGFRSHGYEIIVGRSARENDELLRGHAKGNDIWMHTRYVPGGHVFIRTVAGKSVPLEVLLDAGNLAVFYSKARSDGRADLYYTRVKYLRRAKHAPIGTVLPTQEKNLSVRIDDARIARLFATRNEP